MLNNHDLNQVTWEQRVMEGDPKFRGRRRTSPTSPTPRYAELLGLQGHRGRQRPSDVGAAWDAGAARPTGPCVLEAITDPDVPPLPPHITLKQATAFAEAMLEGDEDTGGMIKQSMQAELARSSCRAQRGDRHAPCRGSATPLG